MINVTILGNNSALPAYGRHPTAQAIAIHNQSFLMDCGEGTQAQMHRFGIKPSHINHIFISHLHGDHYFGLIGLLSSLTLWHRVNPIHLYGPADLKTIIDLQFEASGGQFTYPLHFHDIERDETKTLLDTKHHTVSCFPVNHRIACHGFSFVEKNTGRKLNLAACQEYNIPKTFFNQLKQGEDYQFDNGRVIDNKTLTFNPPPNKTYAFCADTRYEPNIIPHIKDIDMIYHESTFLNDDEEKAFNRYHSTAAQAADIAKRAGVGKLLLGHYSSRYKDSSGFEEEAKTVFPNSVATREGESYKVL